MINRIPSSGSFKGEGEKASGPFNSDQLADLFTLSNLKTLVIQYPAAMLSAGVAAGIMMGFLLKRK